MDMERIENFVDSLLIKTNDLDFLICELRKNNISQGETHFVLNKKFKNMFSFQEIGERIVNSKCWKEELDENMSIENEIINFLKKDDSE